MKSAGSSGITPVLTQDTSTTSFTMDVWMANPPNGEAAPGDGTGGTQVPVESSNPSTNRVVRVNAFTRGAVQIMGAGFMRLLCVGGTTLLVQPWFFDNTLNAWVKFGAVITITVGTTNSATITVGAMAGAKFFFQVTGQTGNPTNFGQVFA